MLYGALCGAKVASRCCMESCRGAKLASRCCMEHCVEPRWQVDVA